MFGKKKLSWYCLALWSLLFSGAVYSVSRFFMHAVNKESKRDSRKKGNKVKKLGPEELFI